jgi:cobalt-precorrin-5B (C1)-methyltransferase
MSNRGVQRHSTAAWRKEDLREGFTTGACAAASAAAATRALLTGQTVTEITIALPTRAGAVFHIVRCEFAFAGVTRVPSGVTCGTIKDAGDDPDVTDGAEVQATVTWAEEPGIQIAGGRGVGLVTLPGLPVDVGQAAINPAPRRQIEQAVMAEIVEQACPEERGEAEGQLGPRSGRGLRVTISVPGGEELAAQTMNPRLGIVGGISILGTTGIVKPFSESAYRASIYLELKVAAQNGAPRAILTTGRRSELYALDYNPEWTELGCVQVGDHIGYGLRQARRLEFQEVVLSGMIGKLSKVAQGRMQTHVSEGDVDFGFLAQLATELGADPALVARVRTANTARHVQNMLGQAGITGLEALIARLAAHKASEFIEGAFSVQVLLFDIGGELLAMERRPVAHGGGL